MEAVMSEAAENRKLGSVDTLQTGGRGHVAKGDGETILLAEHDIHVFDTYTRILRMLGYKVLAAASVSETIRLHKVFSADIDLFILDCTMPWFAVNQPLQQMRNMNPGIRAIFVTGDYERCPVKPEEHGEAGGDQVLLKPFSIVELSLAIRRALDGH